MIYDRVLNAVVSPLALPKRPLAELMRERVPRIVNLIRSTISAYVPRYWLFCIMHIWLINADTFRDTSSFPRFTLFQFTGGERRLHSLSVYLPNSLTRCSDQNRKRNAFCRWTRFVGRPWCYSFRIPGHLVLPCLRNRWTSRRARRY